MANTEYWIKTTDTAPSLDAILTSGRPDDRDLAGSTVTLWLQATFPPYAVFEDEAFIVDAVARHVRYSWEEPVPLAPGVWAGEWRVVWPDTLTATYPNTGYFYLKVVSALPVAIGG